MGQVRKFRRSFSDLARKAARISRRPAAWLLIVVVAVVLSTVAADHYLKDRNRHDLYTSAMIMMMSQPGGFTFPSGDLSSLLDMMHAMAPEILEQFIKNPTAACSLVRCDKFITPVEGGTIVALATATRAVQDRQETSDSAFWARSFSVISLVVSLLAFAVNTLRPALVSDRQTAVQKQRFSPPPIKRKVRHGVI